MKIKLNWKIRSQNPMFYIQIILSFFIPVLGYLGLNWSEMTTWNSLFDMILAAFSNPYCLSIAAVSVFNAIVDSKYKKKTPVKQVIRGRVYSPKQEEKKGGKR